MKTLDEFNAERRVMHNKLNDNSPRLNGIECPKCGLEMYDSSPMMTLTSNPPKKNVHCACGYHGYRIA